MYHAFSCLLTRKCSQGRSFGVEIVLLGWEFPKIRGTLFWGPYNKDPTI